MTMYIDSNVEIEGKVTTLFDKMQPGDDIGLWRLGRSMEDEISWVVAQKYKHSKKREGQINTQMKEYFNEGFPGLPYPSSSFYRKINGSLHKVIRNVTFYGKAIIRDLRNKRADDVGRFWWQAFLKGAKRDQLWLPYAIWKAGAQVHDFGELGFEELGSEYAKILGIWHGHTKRNTWLSRQNDTKRRYNVSFRECVSNC